MTRSIDQMISQEVLCCMSHVVATLATGHGHNQMDKSLEDFCEQAGNLCAPIDDYEEAAIQAGWSRAETGSTQNAFVDKHDGQTWCCAGWQELCEEFDIEPYQREIFEHWAVSEWLAEKLEAKGERVDRDFGNLCVWGRTTSGQGIASDYVIEQIYNDTHDRKAA